MQNLLPYIEITRYMDYFQDCALTNKDPWERHLAAINANNRGKMPLPRVQVTQKHTPIRKL
ncbi:MAG: hypothetical protein DRR11_12825 [Gammaproteobacteria bacterium]|nr:MAG: hypothetical protein DRR11_12825 [Gammaproteobacteria bacterium]